MIAPSLLSADFMNLSGELSRIEQAGADMLHLDIMDGHFVPNISFGPGIIKQIRDNTSIFLDVHLMLSEPARYIDAFHSAGADSLTVHVEADPHLHRTLCAIRNKGMKAGVSINPSTPVCMLEEILHAADLVLVMSVNPGFGGQLFIKDSLHKIKRVKNLINDRKSNTQIQVDGGVTPDNAQLLWQAGADILVAGSSVFGKENYGEAINALRRKQG